jgi:hypothetical protein
MIITPVICSGSQASPPDPIDKVIKMMIIQKKADQEKRKLEKQQREISRLNTNSESW